MAKKKQTDAPDGFAVFKQDLKTESFGRLYFFHGEEHYLRDHYL